MTPLSPEAIFLRFEARHEENLRRFTALEKSTEKLAKDIDSIRRLLMMALGSTLLTFAVVAADAIMRFNHG